MNKPVCVIVGVGEGNGAAFAIKFSQEGYYLVLLARSGSFIHKLASDLGDSTAYECDVSDKSNVEQTFQRIKKEIGAPDVVIYNAGSGTWGTIEEITPEMFESSWRVNTLGLLLVSQEVVPAMKEKGKGNIIVIGATASRRGNIKTAAFAPAKAAQRSLAESMARYLWPLGVHVSLIIIDGIIDLPATRAKMPDKPDHFFVKPEDVAKTAFWLTEQPRSTWSFEVEARPFAETW